MTRGGPFPDPAPALPDTEEMLTDAACDEEPLMHRRYVLNKKQRQFVSSSE